MRCLFLLGAHRSGTTWLHQMLAQSSELASISYAEIRQQLHTGEEPLLLQQLERELWAIGSDRGFDSVPIGADLPEEYGFILEKSAINLYADRPISNVNFEPLRQLIASQRDRLSHPSLLLKNPVDFYDGFLRLADAFPDSAFIFLHRHPWAVFRSQVLAWRHLARRHNAYLASLDAEYARVMADPLSRVALQFSHHTRAGLEVILLTLADACDFHLAHEEALQADQVALRYEDLCADPEGQLARLCHALGLSALCAPASRLSAQPRQPQEDHLLREVFATHAHRFEPYCTWQGYALAGSATA